MEKFIKKLISKLKAGVDKECVSSVPKIRLCDAISIVNQLAKEHNNGWISCSKRLPKKHGDYLCMNESGEVMIGYPMKKISQDGFYAEKRTADGVEGMDFVVYWQPLPDVPKESSTSDVQFHTEQMGDLISRSELLKKFCINSKGERIPEVDCDNIQVTVSIKDVKRIIREEPTACDMGK